MARTSVKSKKSIYQMTREDLGLSREKASELLEGIAPERIERIENGKFTAHPDEVLLMAEKYKAPQLCNYFCANECEIGKQYVPEVQIKHLSQIVLAMVASINTVKKNQERLIEMTADGVIDEDEIDEFIEIQDNLERISIAVEALQLWTEKKLSSGSINQEAYRKAREKMK